MSQSNSWLLSNAQVAQAPQHATRLDLETRSGRISSVGPALPHHRASSQLDLTGMLILPGLVNAHDHLEFALFPRMGNRTYTNSREWALDIYRPDQPPVRELLQVPKSTRLFWGGLKNLLCGVTTVCHHNQYEPDTFDEGFPVRVLKRFGWSHSLSFSQDVRGDFTQAPDGAPFFIHLAEGTDEASRKELERLDRLGLLNAQTVIVHGVALTPPDWKLVKQRDARLVCCPSSNLFTLGRTVDLSKLPRDLEVALGSDSPLTAAGDLLDEIRFAHDLQIHPNPLLGAECNFEKAARTSLQGWMRPIVCNPALDPSEGGESATGTPGAHVGSATQLYPMVTTLAAHLLGLNQGEGTIVEGGVADLFVVSDTGVSPAQRLARLSAADIELVMLRGEIMVVSDLLASQIPSALLGGMQRLFYYGKEFFVSRNIQPHWQATHQILGDDFRLGGKEIRLVMR